MKLKKISRSPKLFVTTIMKESWRDFCGESKIPRSPEKFLRKFLRTSRNELKDMSLVLKATILDQFKDRIFPISVVAKQSDSMALMLSKIHDTCPNCRLRYRNQIDKQIELCQFYYKQAKKLFDYCSTKESLLTITSENIFLEEVDEIFPEDIIEEHVLFLS